MSQAAALHHLADVLGEVGSRGQATNRDRTSRIEGGLDDVGRLPSVWLSPVSQDIQEAVTRLLRVARSTDPDFDRGYGTLNDLATDARSIAGDLERAAAEELSWFQRVGTLANAVSTGVSDMLDERELAAHERARDDYHAAMRRHDAARSERQQLEQRWRQLADSAAATVAAAVAGVTSLIGEVKAGASLLEERHLDPALARFDIQLEWSLHVASVVRNGDPRHTGLVWAGLDERERRVLIETLPGLVDNHLRAHLSNAELAYLEQVLRHPVNRLQQSYDGRVGVDVKWVQVGVGGGLELERVYFSDDSVQVRVQPSAFAEAGIDLEVVEAFIGVERNAWVVLSFASVAEYDAFIAGLESAFDAERNRWRPESRDLLFAPLGVPGYVGRRLYGSRDSEVVRFLNDAYDNNVDGFGVQEELYGRLGVEVPGVYEAATRGSAGMYYDGAAGEAGVLVTGEYSQTVGQGGGRVSSEGSYELRVYTTELGRHYVTVEADSAVLGGVGTPPGTPIDAGVEGGFGHRVSMTLEIRPENEAQLEALVDGVTRGSWGQVAEAARTLEDASHITSTTYSTIDGGVGGSGSTGRGVAISGSGSVTTEETLRHAQKFPQDEYVTRNLLRE